MNVLEKKIELITHYTIRDVIGMSWYLIYRKIPDVIILGGTIFFHLHACFMYIIWTQPLTYE